MASSSDGTSEDPQTPFGIELTDEAVYAYSEVHPDDVYNRIGTLIDFLTLHPYYGEEYDPAYETAQPPVACRVFFCARYGVYYHVNEGNRMITILAIEDQRRDPLARFTVVEG